MSIKIVQPSKEVELHLPDGRVLSGPRGTQVGEFLQKVKDDFGAPIVAAIINNEIHELTFPVEIEVALPACHHDTADGARIYRRSLIFLLEIAFADLFPKAKLTIDHSVSSGGFYCQVTGHDELTQSELDALKTHMQKLVEEDWPFERKQVPIQEAIEYFKKLGYEDKVRLFSHRQKTYLTLYSLGRSHGLSAWLHGSIHWLFALVRSQTYQRRFHASISAPACAHAS